MPKRLSPEEKQQKEWRNDLTLDYVMLCKCGKVIECMQINHTVWCKCGRPVFEKHEVVKKNCRVLYER